MRRWWSLIVAIAIAVAWWLYVLNVAPRPGRAPAVSEPIASIPSAPAIAAPAPKPASGVIEDSAEPVASAPEPVELPSFRSLDEAFCDPPGEGPRTPHDAAAAEILLEGFRKLHTPGFESALDPIARYLALAPNDMSIIRLQRRLTTQAEIQRDFAHRELRGVTLAYPPESMSSAEAGVILSQIDSALDNAAGMTNTRRRKELYAVVYRDRSELLAVTCQPAWTNALFDGTLRLPLGAKEEDVRHETMHAQLAPRIGSHPRWFHEGLAQYFAARGQIPWRRSFDLMLRNRTYIPFRSLEGRFQEMEQAEDAHLAYAESAALVSLLAAKYGDAGIARAVELVREKKDILDELALREEDVLDHLSTMPKRR